MRSSLNALEPFSAGVRTGNDRNIYSLIENQSEGTDLFSADTKSNQKKSISKRIESRTVGMLYTNPTSSRFLMCRMITQVYKRATAGNATAAHPAIQAPMPCNCSLGMELLPLKMVCCFRTCVGKEGGARGGM
jgi:hypothetical protein